MKLYWKETIHNRACVEEAVVAPYLSPFAKCLEGIVNHSPSIFVDVSYWPPYNTNKFMPYVYRVPRSCSFTWHCTFLQHHLRPALRRKGRYLVVQNPIILRDNAGSHTVSVTELLHSWQWRDLICRVPAFQYGRPGSISGEIRNVNLDFVTDCVLCLCCVLCSLVDILTFYWPQIQEGLLSRTSELPQGDSLY